MLIMQEAGINSVSKVWLVPPGAVDYFWSQLEVIFKSNGRGLLDGYYTLETVRKAISEGSFDLWIGVNDEREIECVALCQLEVYAQFKLYRISWAGGKVKPHLPDALSRIEDYARNVVGADRVALDGRLGWVRALERFGYGVVRFELWKPLHSEH